MLSPLTPFHGHHNLSDFLTDHVTCTLLVLVPSHDLQSVDFLFGIPLCSGMCRKAPAKEDKHAQVTIG